MKRVLVYSCVLVISGFYMISLAEIAFGSIASVEISTMAPEESDCNCEFADPHEVCECDDECNTPYRQTPCDPVAE